MSGIHEDKLERGSLEPFMCQIPLKQTDKPLNEEAVQKMKKFMVDEYAVRYLESIGAAPTPANLRAVRKEIPMRRFKLTAAFKSRGGLEDMFYISNVEPTNQSRQTWRAHAARSLFSDMVDKRLGGLGIGDEDQQPATTKDKDPLSLDTQPHRGVPKVQKPPDAQAQNKPPPLSLDRKDDVASRVALARLGGPQPTSRSMKSRRERRRPVKTAPAQDDTSLGALRAQQRGRLLCTVDDILSLQTLFVRSFPMGEIRARILTDELSTLVGELTSIALAKLILMIATVVEWASSDEEEASHLPHPLALSADEEARGLRVSAALEAMLLSIFNDWVEMQGRITKQSLKVLAFPIYLMLVRVGVETALRNALPAFFKGLQGEGKLLARIDRVVTSLLDPDGYLNFPPPAPPGRAFISNLAPSKSRHSGGAGGVLESLARGANTPWAPVSGGGRKGHVSAKFHTVSPLVKNIFAVAAAPQLHRLKHMIEAASRPAHHRGQSQDVRTAGAPLPLLIGDGDDPLAAILTPDNVNRIYLLALKKRQQRRDMEDKIKAQLTGLKLTLEEREDEALHLLLPIGIEHLLEKRNH